MSTAGTGTGSRTKRRDGAPEPGVRPPSCARGGFPGPLRPPLRPRPRPRLPPRPPSRPYPPTPDPGPCYPPVREWAEPGIALRHTGRRAAGRLRPPGSPPSRAARARPHPPPVSSFCPAPRRAGVLLPMSRPPPRSGNSAGRPVGRNRGKRRVLPEISSRRSYAAGPSGVGISPNAPHIGRYRPRMDPMEARQDGATALGAKGRIAWNSTGRRSSHRSGCSARAAVLVVLEIFVVSFGPAPRRGHRVRGGVDRVRVRGPRRGGMGERRPHPGRGALRGPVGARPHPLVAVGVPRSEVAEDAGYRHVAERLVVGPGARGVLVTPARPTGRARFAGGECDVQVHGPVPRDGGRGRRRAHRRPHDLRHRAAALTAALGEGGRRRPTAPSAGRAAREPGSGPGPAQEPGRPIRHDHRAHRPRDRGAHRPRPVRPHLELVLALVAIHPLQRPGEPRPRSSSCASAR